MESPDPVYVPIRECSAGFHVLRICRRPDGLRTGVAFSTAARFDQVAGGGTPRVVLSLRVLHSMLAEIGISDIQLDPELMVSPATAARVS